MFTKSARYYDLLYAFKDYGKAARELDAFVQSRCPHARSVLDVACGTGRHLELLQGRYEVTGLDVSAELLAIASRRLPGVPLHEADMTTLDLGTRFDVVTCLFSSIAYVRTLDKMRRAVLCMAAHVEPGGLLLIEPWFAPGQYWTGRLTTNHVAEEDIKITWMYVSEQRDLISVLDIHYLVATRAGVECFNELHELGLFTPDEYRAAIVDAGLKHEYHEHGFFGRGLHVGIANQ